MVFNAPYLEYEHGDSPLFLAFWQKLIFTLLHGKFKKYVRGNILSANAFKCKVDEAN